jgi:hypothetical protein
MLKSRPPLSLKFHRLWDKSWGLEASKSFLITTSTLIVDLSWRGDGGSESNNETVWKTRTSLAFITNNILLEVGSYVLCSTLRAVRRTSRHKQIINPAYICVYTRLRKWLLSPQLLVNVTQQLGAETLCWIVISSLMRNMVRKCWYPQVFKCKYHTYRKFSTRKNNLINGKAN